MTKKCSNCGETIDDESLFCPKCGSHAKVKSSENSYQTKWVIITGICIIMLILVTSTLFINHSSRTDTALSMISDSNLGSSDEYVVQLKDANGNPLADKFITVELNNNTYTLVTDGNGAASINLTVGDGSFEVKSFFKGDDDYNEAHTSDIIIK